MKNEKLSKRAEKRLWAKISPIPGQGPQGDCYTWEGGAFRDGEPIFRIANKGKAYRVVDVLFEQYRGEIHDGFEAVSDCGLPLCCRPDHLILAVKEECPEKEKRVVAMWQSQRIEDFTTKAYTVRKVKYLLNRGFTDSEVSRHLGQSIPLTVIDEIACTMSKRDGARWVPFRQKAVAS